MKKRFLTACILLIMVVTAGSQSSAPNFAPRESHLNWRPWSDAVLVEARRGHRFVLLDLEAVWCHWCHVMDANTYSDPEVIKLLQAHYITVKVDQDSRPDLSNRYEDYGWPATVVFDSDGHEIAKRQGYLAAEEMACTQELSPQRSSCTATHSIT